jgi:hypothetical protein
MDHGAEWQVLGMRRHSPAGNQDDKPRDEISLWSSIPLSAQPDSSKTCTPPNDTHSRVLDIIPNPGASPLMLSESIDAAPSRNQKGIEEFL